ncbi:MAG TPA: HdeD family acid-resistance protein [Casimicrobiaceae bacterium]|nr:HdeD family acid-resistance protein [Casimicrobiaceae bacterium]
MATAQPASSANPHGHRRGWSIAWGILLIVIGILALLMPEVAALATVLTLAWLLIFAGVVELVHAFQTRRRSGFGWKLAAAIITLILGLCILLFPVAGIATLALWIGAFIFAGGIVRLILAFRVRPAKGWGWVLFDGLLAIVIGGLIAWGWPASSIGFIGLLTGFWLLFSGVWRIMLDGRAPQPGEGGVLSHAA